MYDISSGVVKNDIIKKLTVLLQKMNIHGGVGHINLHSIIILYRNSIDINERAESLKSLTKLLLMVKDNLTMNLGIRQHQTFKEFCRFIRGD